MLEVTAPVPTGDDPDGDESPLLTPPQALDLSLRAWAARGGLAAAAVLYTAGLFALGVFVGLFDHWPAAQPDQWHIVVTAVIALFSVPTLILLTVIRSSAQAKQGADPSTANLHTLIGEKVLNLLEKLADKAIARG